MPKQSHYPVVRTDPDFLNDMKKLAKIRLDNGLAKMNPRDLSFAEMCKILRRGEHYKPLCEELKFKPKRENIKC
jgi:hypothetical protein